jgi:hypothetical protein
VRWEQASGISVGRLLPDCRHDNDCTVLKMLGGRCKRRYQVAFRHGTRNNGGIANDLWQVG